MLILSRLEGQKVFIGDDIVIQVFDIGNGKVKLGIECPREIAVHREEVKARIDRDELDRKLGHRATPGGWCGSTPARCGQRLAGTRRLSAGPQGARGQPVGM